MVDLYAAQYTVFTGIFEREQGCVYGSLVTLAATVANRDDVGIESVTNVGIH